MAGEKIELQIQGLSCADCAEKVTAAVETLPGVSTVSYDIMSGRLTADLDRSIGDLESVIRRIRKDGYEARRLNEEKADSWWNRYKKQIPILIAALAWGIAAGFAYAKMEFTASILFMFAIAMGFLMNYRKTRSSLVARSLDMNVLVAAAAAGAVFLGEYAEGAMVLILFALADLLETYSMNRAQRAVEKLMTLAPETVRLIDDLDQRLVPPDQVDVGAMILIKPGERIGLDGVVESGESEVNQAPVTGEPLPVYKGKGNEVYAGTINGEGVLRIRTTRRASDSTLSRIIALVRDQESVKAPSEKFIERFAKIYTPVVFLIAALVTLVPVLAFSAPFAVWFYRSLVILLVACPCAFIIATPVTLVSGLAAGARAGVLIKGGAGMEQAAKIKAVAFDKTGTLTLGKPRVFQVIPINGTKVEDLLAIAASVESESEHLIGEAIVAYTKEQGVTFRPALNVRALPGLGAVGEVESDRVTVGSHKLFHQQDLCDDNLHRIATDLEGQEKIIVFVGRKERAQGIIVLADKIREDAKQALLALKRVGIIHLAMLSGDNNPSAMAVGNHLGMDQVEGDLMPEQKVLRIQEIREKYGPVAMVGDGINDAPALAASDFGIAMGEGSDHALETAGAALMSGRLSKLSALFELSQKTTHRIKANVAIALSIKLVFLILAVFGAATLWMGVFADTGATLIVIANGLRLLRFRPNQGQ